MINAIQSRSFFGFASAAFYGQPAESLLLAPDIRALKTDAPTLPKRQEGRVFLDPFL